MKSFLLAFIVFACTAMLTQYLAYQRYLIAVESEREKVFVEINAVKERLKTSLSYSLSATQTLAFLVKEYGVPANFSSVAKEIIASNKYIDALELTNGGEITHVYPLQGNEAAIGYNVLNDSLRVAEANRAIEKKELFFAGPFELKQGGMAVVGRLPIFIDNRFLGFSVVLIKLSTLLKAAGLDTLESKDFYYQLSKVNPFTRQEEFFLPQIAPYHQDQCASIEVPDGEWKLYVTSKAGMQLFYPVITLSVLGLVLSFTGALFAGHLARQPEKLKRLVEAKTILLASSEKYFRSLIEKSSDAIVLLDATGKVLYQSHSTGRITGYSLAEVQSLEGIELIHPDDRQEDFTMFSRLAQSPGAVESRTHRFRHKDGHYLWIEGTYTNLLNDEHIKAIVYNYHDITDRKRAEQEIVLERNFSVSIVNSLPGVFYLYDRQGKFMRWNKNFEIVSGYNADEISTMHPLDFFDVDEKDLLVERIDSVFNTGHGDVMAHFYTRGKKKIPYYFNGQKATFDNVDYLIGMGIDITERVKAENELRKRTEEIQKLTAYMERIREEERTRMSREIHDELGQQLTGLKMDASWITKKITAEEKLIHEKLVGMIGLIDETMKTVRRISSELRPGILDDLGLIPALEWQTLEFERRTGIESKFQSFITDFHPERELSTNIFRVYQEALTNIARHANATKVQTVLEQVNGYITLIVEDNGQGFDMKDIEKKNSLGLVGMKERARMFNGELIIDRKMPRGTVVILSIPMVISTEKILS
jgi:PAS domain S-box-containing protein